MAFQAAPDCAKVALVHAHITNQLVNIFHFKRSGQWGIPELESLLNAVATSWVNDVMPHLSSPTLFLRAEGRGLRGQNDVSSELVAAQPVNGGRPGEGLPGNVCFVITHLTGLTGRTNRGRSYLGGLAKSDVINDQISSVRANALRDGLGSVRSQASQAGWTMVVLSRAFNKQIRPQALPIEVIGFRYRDLTVDSQRRRLTGRGA